jgi:hypothetical protein
LDIENWNLFGPFLRSGGACNLLFPVYPGKIFAVPILALTAWILSSEIFAFYVQKNIEVHLRRIILIHKKRQSEAIPSFVNRPSSIDIPSAF